MIRIDKEWGFEQIICNTELYCSKFLHVSPGKQCSLHYHQRKDETFYVLDGEAFITVKDNAAQVFKGESVHISPGTLHRFASKEGCILLETSTHHDDEDVFRMEPSGTIPAPRPVASTTFGAGIFLGQRNRETTHPDMESPT